MDAQRPVKIVKQRREIQLQEAITLILWHEDGRVKIIFGVGIESWYWISSYRLKLRGVLDEMSRWQLGSAPAVSWEASPTHSITETLSGDEK